MAKPFVEIEVNNCKRYIKMQKITTIVLYFINHFFVLFDCDFRRRTTSETRKQMTLKRGQTHKKIGWWKRTKYSIGIVSIIMS